MTVRTQDAKRPVSALLAGPQGHPYHPMLVALPIGAWVTSLVFDVASRVTSHAAFLALGSRWLIGAGLAGAVLAGAVGLLDLAVIPPGTPAFRTACAHMYLNLTLIFAYAGNFAWRYRIHSHGAPVRAGMIALSAVSIAVLCVSGYLGGKLTYRYGVRVAPESMQADGFVTAGEAVADSPRAAGY